ncbi:hypothetical protein IGI04_031470 [Brassica rapa subsp. trilocularis]|uniref:RNase H type-1 domain-containing protein n=1 Tax=Brassica rapa subsp. trilocularis TaxID=1813537 RepID=A0ABQ7LTN3_BRACM|nr:hypothetical protein IGI04_031470 [Brassica rapa subsp. trilocularis]
MFPELSAADRKMAMLYISHSGPTERLARIERVKQGISENMAASSVHLTRITKELDKGKGHVFSYTELLESQQCGNSSQCVAPLQIRDKSDEDRESSASKFSTRSEPVVPSGFQLGPSSEGRVTGNLGANKAQRRRPPSWKRRAVSGSLQPPVSTSTPQNTELAQSSKRKAGFLTLNGHLKETGEGLHVDPGESHLWSKPPVSWVKCNIGSSWDSSSLFGGAGWIIRDAHGKALLHSRRSFNHVLSAVQMDLMALAWATSAVVDLKLKNVIFEFSSAEAAMIIQNPLLSPFNYKNCYEILRSVQQAIVRSKLQLVSVTSNNAASAIAVSVTRDLRHHSYVASNGPQWLAPLLSAEAAPR